MSETQGSKRKVQGRSPPFPFIPLEKAIERARQLGEYSRGHPVRMLSAVNGAWGYNAKSSGGIQTVAALKAFGLITDAGSGDDRKIALSEDAVRLQRNPPAQVIKEILWTAALRPKVIEEYYHKWGTDRPPDEECRWNLIDERGFTPEAAKTFLAVYDATLAFAGLLNSDTGDEVAQDVDRDMAPLTSEQKTVGSRGSGTRGTTRDMGRDSPRKVVAMEGERVVFAEENSPDQYLRLVASGQMDEFLLDALSDYVERQRKRLNADKQRRFDEMDRNIPASRGGSFKISPEMRKALREKGYSDEHIDQMGEERVHKELNLIVGPPRQ